MTKTPKIRMYIVNKRQALGLSMRETSRLLHMDFHYYYGIELGSLHVILIHSQCGNNNESPCVISVTSHA